MTRNVSSFHLAYCTQSRFIGDECSIEIEILERANQHGHGRASGIAKVFADHGAKVVVADIQDDSGHSLAKALGPSNSSYVHGNVTDEAQVRNAVNRAITTFGKS